MNLNEKVNFIMNMIVDLPELREIKNKFRSGAMLSDHEVRCVLSCKGRYTRKTPSQAWTLVNYSALVNLKKLIEDTLDNNIEGDFIETGVWRGGVCILAKSIYNKYRSNKRVFVADSFEGLPPPDPKYPLDALDEHYKHYFLKVDLDTVINNFRLFGCLDDNVTFLQGWFKDTMPTAPIDKLSILRLDGDMYQSTIEVLENLYPKLSVGGYCIIDDYQHNGCHKAVSHYRRSMDIRSPIIKSDLELRTYDEVVYWRKE